MGTDYDFLERVYKRRDEIISRSIAGETILVPITGNLADMQKIFSLNPVGEFIWEHLDGGRKLSEISGDLQDFFDVGKEEADADIRKFVSELLKEDLVSAAD
jgi:hypothetical protein